MFLHGNTSHDIIHRHNPSTVAGSVHVEDQSKNRKMMYQQTKT